MKFTLLFFLVALSLCSFLHAADQPEDGIFVLNDKTFTKVVSKRQFVLILFENATATEKDPLVKEYSMAALKLQGICPQLKLWRFNSTLSQERQIRYNISSFPAIRLFVDNGYTPKIYNGGNTSQAIIKWFVNEMENNNTNLHIKDIEQANNLVKNKTHVAFYFGAHNSSGYLNFLSGLIALNDPSITVASSQNPELAKNFTVPNNTFVFFRHFDTERNVFQYSYEHKLIKEFCMKRMHPAVMPWDKKAVRRFSNEEMDGLFLFRSNTSSEDLKKENIIREMAQEFRDNITFVVAGEQDLEHGPLIKKFHVDEDDFPKVGIIQSRQNGKVFLLDREFSEKNLRIFLANFMQDNLAPTRLQEKAPKPVIVWEDDVAVVSKQTYQQIVLDSKKSVLVEAYNPRCGACIRFAPTYSALAKKVRSVKGLLVTKVDVTQGQIDEFYQISGTPTVVLYVNGKKNSPIKYQGTRTEEDMMKFLTEHLGPLMV